MRPSIPPSRDFSLAPASSRRFGSTTADLSPSSDSLALRLHALQRLTSPAPVTRRFILQEARHHPSKGTLTGCPHTVSGSLSLPSRGAFHRSLTVLFTIGGQTGPSLGWWATQLPVGRHDVPAVLGVNSGASGLVVTGLLPARVAVSTAFTTSPDLPGGSAGPPCVAPQPAATPASAVAWVGAFGHGPRSLAATWGLVITFGRAVLRCFSSRPDSVARVGDGLRGDRGAVPRFGHLEIAGCSRLPLALRGGPRPSSSCLPRGIPRVRSSSSSCEVVKGRAGGPRWDRTTALTLIRRALFR